MGLSKIDLIRIKAYAVKVRNGMPLDEVPEKYRDAVSYAHAHKPETAASDGNPGGQGLRGGNQGRDSEGTVGKRH